MSARWMRNSFIYLPIIVLIIVAMMAIFFTRIAEPLGGSREVSLSQVISMAALGQLDTIEVRGDKLTVITTSGETLTSRQPGSASVVEVLEEATVDPSASNVQVIVKGSSGLSSRIMESSSGGGGVVVLIFMTLAGLAFVGAVFWVWMLAECALKEPDEGNTKIVWTIIIVFTNIIGAVLYFLFVRRPRRRAEGTSRP